MNKHDTVIGYIEYLDCNGCVRERIPYVDGAMFAMSTLSILPAVLIFIFFQKYLVEGISTSGLKG